MRSTKDGKNHVIILERGEDVIPALEKYCAEHGITAGVFTGIGAVNKIEIGYYEFEKREYHFRSEAGDFEVASMNGNVALFDPEGGSASDGAGGKPFIHAHAVLSRCDKTLECIGAHIKKASVAVTLEVFLTEMNVGLTRKHDDFIGLKLLNV
ncbi:MAG TPA: PPC domain-containing DNA-binding protein [Candidatus Paceibacterota bacterium]|nr:PPC domain-containing DNA-binding protein [Candidatus Paceibacterota bacterium]